MTLNFFERRNPMQWPDFERIFHVCAYHMTQSDRPFYLDKR